MPTSKTMILKIYLIYNRYVHFSISFIDENMFSLYYVLSAIFLKHCQEGDLEHLQYFILLHYWKPSAEVVNYTFKRSAFQ